MYKFKKLKENAPEEPVLNIMHTQTHIVYWIKFPC